MEVSISLVIIGVLVLCAYILNGLFDKLRIPNALFLLLIGLLIGPILGFIEPDDFGKTGSVFVSVTLIIILFESSTKINIKELASSIGPALGISITNYLIGMSVASLSLYYFVEGITPFTCVFFGAIIAGTSSAIVIPIVRQLKLSKKAENVLIMESALSDVLALVIGISILSAIVQQELSITTMFSSLLQTFLFSIGIGAHEGYIWANIYSTMTSIQSHGFITLGLILAFAGGVDLLGLNSGIAVLTFGLIFANSHLVNTDNLKLLSAKRLDMVQESFFSEVSFLIQTLFFVYIGIHMQLDNLNSFLIAGAILLIIILTRPFVTKLFIRKPMAIRDLASVSMLFPKGIVPAILATLPLQMGLEYGQEIKDVAYSTVLLSIILSSVLVLVASMSKSSFLSFKWLYETKPVEEEFVEQAETESTEE
jgi:NhaP-type Na+/H+ or K+/H+ antiporter